MCCCVISTVIALTGCSVLPTLDSTRCLLRHGVAPNGTKLTCGQATVLHRPIETTALAGSYDRFGGESPVCPVYEPPWER